LRRCRSERPGHLNFSSPFIVHTLNSHSLAESSNTNQRGHPSINPRISAVSRNTTKMGQFYETFPPSLVQWLLEQKVFYIASAPLSGEGHVNVSPKGVSDKGGPFFGVIKERKPSAPAEPSDAESADGSDDKNVVIRKFWYMDLTGSGIETTSHLHEPGNGRITVMFNAFCGPPRILRIFGKGMFCTSMRETSQACPNLSIR
jgi:hypothetical protein